MTDVCNALPELTRRAIVDELRQRDGRSVFEPRAWLAATCGLTSSRQAGSQHLDRRGAAGPATARRQGRYKLLLLDTAPADPGRRELAGRARGTTFP